jgi:hypothetical protein
VLAENALSENAKDRCLDLCPSPDESEARRRLGETTEARLHPRNERRAAAPEHREYR